MKILVTGASGFIGRETIQPRNDMNFVAVHRNTESHIRQRNDGTSAYFIDSLGRETNWNGAFSGVNAVIHLAGMAHQYGSSTDFYRINVEGSKNLALQAADAGVERFVFVSSIGVNGAMTTTDAFEPNSNPFPHNSYTQSKYEAELQLKDIAISTGIELVIVRPTLVYGPSAPGNFGRLFNLIQKTPILPFGIVNNRRSFISVQNLADLLLTCAIHPNANGQTFLASDGCPVSLREFTDELACGVSKKILQLPIPTGLMRLFAGCIGKSTLAEQLFSNLEVDSSNTKEVLDWTPPYTMKQSMALIGGKL
ncbi:NAD-dependent epimerase/dehydratase family protein [Vibrio sp. F74]|uniref:NAD-dependent epimerase/dehydratase family protein n=1 Tax=Vibrio sp. F74 TaxID=700020 RepID=UPI0035F5920B